ncbi:MAG: thioredoxin family protein [Ignavibacteriaceae bacterium]|jgi:thiol-disulfide isomerase/thioredoxin
MRNVLVIWILMVIGILPQKNYKIILDEKSGKSMAVGECPPEVFRDSSFSWWFNAEMSNYEVKSELLNKQILNTEGVSVITVLGTWCSDSRREVPRFLKILKEINFPEDQNKFICVDRTKDAFFIDISEMDIKLVPTFIVFRDGAEIGRIIETPIVSLEQDLIDILLRAK